MKQLVPWQAMAKRPTSARNSLLLDYVSSQNIICLFTSIKSSHYPVTLVIFGSLIIKLATVFSSGLFALQDVLEDREVSLHIVNRFDGNFFDSSSVDTLPVLTINGIQRYNLPYPQGTTENYTLQSFNISSSRSTSSELFSLFSFP